STAGDAPDGLRGLRDAPGSALLDRRPHERGQQRALGRQPRDLPDLPRERREDPGGTARAADPGPQPQCAGGAHRNPRPGTALSARSATCTGTGAGGCDACVARAGRDGRPRADSERTTVRAGGRRGLAPPAAAVRLMSPLQIAPDLVIPDSELAL